MGKKSILFVALLLMLGLSFAVTAEDAEKAVYTSGKYAYILLPDGSAEITGYTGKDAVLTVPDTLDGHPVTSIRAEGFIFNKYLTHVTLPEGITRLGRDAFAGCEALTAVHLPASLTEMDGNPFARCEALANISVAPDHPVFAVINGALMDKTEMKLIFDPAAFQPEEYNLPEGTRMIGEEAFYNAGMTGILLPESLIEIESRAFYFCSSLKNVTLPFSVTRIGTGAFSACYGLTEITLAEGLTEMGSMAFSDCRSLEVLVLPDSLKRIEGNPFVGCDSMTEIRVAPDHPVFAVVDGLLYDQAEKKLICCLPRLGIEAYQLPDGYENMADYAFSNCTSLKKVTLPETMDGLGEGVFSGCTGLTEVKLPEGIEWIDRNSFAFCSGLTGITLPAGIQRIGYRAFAACTGLTEIVLPEGTEMIGDMAFFNCPSLMHITLPSSLDEIGEHAFEYGPEDMLFTVEKDSWAARWCQENGKNYTCPDAPDALNN